MGDRPLAGAPKQRKQPTQDRSTATVEAIVEAAIRILRTDGWARLTTTRVAERAGVSVGSLYQYFPNREAIAVEIVRQRTRAFLDAVVGVDLAGVTNLDEASRRAMTVFLAEKRRTLDLSLALRDTLPEVQGRQAILEEARVYVPALQTKFAGVAGAMLDAARLAMALAAVEGTVWEALAHDPGVLDNPTTVPMLARVFMAALGDATS
ncbi:MAG: TetR/AcrR family transcriptional regulator [Reyranella sp.]|uniref:TetR/AcrR family transcriptional regulator n=1 Tax=Reyranella sp. TaxID=1929291 RepID=UPI0011F50A6B|nr:TetR/AcrR family transcriptional regulator [Reyranella sp.]TAJ40059.1 MAG: TetR/AcrR family transcriptional regulator [Reyranella sp.]